MTELQSALAGEVLSIDTEAAKLKLLQVNDDGLQLLAPMAQPPEDQMAYALEPPEGAMDPDFEFYIQRESDTMALNALQ